jgi:hypothetical protein
MRRHAGAVGNANLISNADKITAFLVDSISKTLIRVSSFEDKSGLVQNCQQTSFSSSEENPKSGESSRQAGRNDPSILEQPAFLQSTFPSISCDWKMIRAIATLLIEPVT